MPERLRQQTGGKNRGERCGVTRRSSRMRSKRGRRGRTPREKKDPRRKGGTCRGPVGSLGNAAARNRRALPGPVRVFGTYDRERFRPALFSRTAIARPVGTRRPVHRRERPDHNGDDGHESAAKGALLPTTDVPDSLQIRHGRRIGRTKKIDEWPAHRILSGYPVRPNRRRMPRRAKRRDCSIRRERGRARSRPHDHRRERPTRKSLREIPLRDCGNACRDAPAMKIAASPAETLRKAEAFRRMK